MSRPQFKFLRRVRIHDGECGAVARALHHKVGIKSLPAAVEKVSTATQERKEMSKRTFFKRVAITAIASLGFGVLSVTPSSALINGHSLTIDAASDSVTVGESATAVLTHQFTALGSLGNEDSVIIQVIRASAPATSTEKVFLSISDSYTGSGNDGTDNNAPDYNWGGVKGASTQFAEESMTSTTAFPTVHSSRDSVTVIADADNTSNTTVFSLKVYAPNVAGTYKYNVYAQAYSDGTRTTSMDTPALTWTVTVAAADVKATAASTATVRYADTAVSTGTAEGTDSTTTYNSYDIASTDTTPEATVWYRLKTGLATNIAQESFTVTVSGNAYITRTTDASVRPNAGNGLKSLQMAVPTADAYVGVEVWSTGDAGTATVSATTSNGVTLPSKTFTFSGPPTKIETVIQYKKTIQANKGSAETSVIAIKVTDAGGRSVVGAQGAENTYAPGIVGSDAQVAATGSCDDTTGDLSARDGTFLCSVTTSVGSTSGSKSTMTARLDDPEIAGTQYITTTFDVTLGGAVSTIVLTTDKATYEPGEWMVITATAKDSSGNTPYDGQTGPTLSANKSLGSTITMNLYYDGVSTSQTRSATSPRTFTNSQTIAAPSASGKFIISGVDGQTTPAPISVTATVSDDGATAAASAATDAALEAIDAANAATDAANLAAEAADAATVAAEEARDAADAATAAVEALATEVATLMAALKAQITTLANTVAKIAKKVKA